MEISPEPAYCFCKVNLYPPRPNGKEAEKPIGAAIVEIYGTHARLTCQAGDYLSYFSKTGLEGRFSMPGEIRDKRIVSFSKGLRVNKNIPEACEPNPIFQRVEPFKPPIPNSVWWRIGIQPYLGMSREHLDYCPRRKLNRAVF